jgi:heptosyltransferase-2
MKIAAFIPNWIGDAVMATPALRALRQRGTTVIGVGKPYVADVFAGGNWFDEYIPAVGGSWSRGILPVAWRLRRIGVDVAVLFSNSFRTALMAWLGFCRRRVGYARYGRAVLLSDALKPVRDRGGRLTPSPVLDAYNRLAETAGCPSPGHRLELFTTAADEAAVDDVWHAGHFFAYGEVICLNSGAAFGSAKHWPSEYFAALARRLATERGCAVLVLCGPAESGLARTIAAAAGHPAVKALADLTPRLSIGLSKACVRRSDLLITTDSGPRHFAAAFDRPVVTLFGPTHVAWTETYYARAIHLQRQVDCGPCQRRVCPLDHRCMRRLLPDEVFAAALRLLQRRATRA